MTRDAVARETPATAATSSRVGALSARKVVMPPVLAGCVSATLRASYRMPAAVRFVRSGGDDGPVKALTGRTDCPNGHLPGHRPSRAVASRAAQLAAGIAAL